MRRDLCLWIPCKEWKGDKDESENSYECWVLSIFFLSWVIYVVLPTKHDKANAWWIMFMFSNHIARIPYMMPPICTPSNTQKGAMCQLGNFEVMVIQSRMEKKTKMRCGAWVMVNVMSDILISTSTCNHYRTPQAASSSIGRWLRNPLIFSNSWSTMH